MSQQCKQKALDSKHDAAERPQCGRKRGGGTASKGAVGVGFSPDAPRPLRSRREGRSAVHNRRAASLPLASLVVRWAFASLLPALRALRLCLPGSNKTKDHALHGLLFCLRLLRYPTLLNLTQDSAETKNVPAGQTESA
jgi:hypothetical protein